MRIRILGAGIYGCHLACALIDAGHEVEVHDIADHIFAGASGNMPARLHGGQHYPRSKLTRDACNSHFAEFMAVYGHMTRAVPVNIYAVAARDSLVDFGTYCRILSDEMEFITVLKPHEFGLANVEGAILTGERHVLLDEMRRHFEREFEGRITFGVEPSRIDDPRWDWTIDATFCANTGINIDRYEPCLTLLLEGPSDKAVTIMDGPFPSLYPWDESRNLLSLTSAKLTPLGRLKTWAEARCALAVDGGELRLRERDMINQMAYYYPAIADYRVVDHRLAIRAMPQSAADARLVDIVRLGERALQVRAGKLDAIFYAEREVRRIIGG